jgi:hypothetical protein
MGILFIIFLTTCYCYFAPHKRRRIKNAEKALDTYPDTYDDDGAGLPANSDKQRPASWREAPAFPQPAAWINAAPPTPVRNPETRRVSQAFGIEPPKTPRPDTAVARVSRISRWQEQVAHLASPPQTAEGFQDPEYFDESRPMTALYTEPRSPTQANGLIGTAPAQPTISEAEMMQHYEREALRPATQPQVTSVFIHQYNL